MLIKYRYNTEGKDIRIVVFVGKDLDHTFQNAGSFLLSPEEFNLFIEGNYESIFDEV
jgi:hypothetical protein